MSESSSTPPLVPGHRRLVPRAWRTPFILGLSAVAHVAVLAISARLQPSDPPGPRTVEVLRWETYATEGGELAWRNSGGVERARVAPEPSSR